MRTPPRLVLMALIGAIPLLAGCNSESNTQATKPTTLAIGTSVSTSITLPNSSSTLPPATVVTTAPPLPTLPPDTVPPTTVAPTSSAPAGTSVTIARGGFITKDHGTCTPTSCKYVQITSSGWAPGQPLAVTCYSSSGSSGPYTKYADSSGNLSAGTVCFFGNAFNVYVAIDGVNSNIISSWKDW